MSSNVPPENEPDKDKISIELQEIHPPGTPDRAPSPQDRPPVGLSKSSISSRSIRSSASLPPANPEDADTRSSPVDSKPMELSEIKTATKPEDAVTSLTSPSNIQLPLNTAEIQASERVPLSPEDTTQLKQSGSYGRVKPPGFGSSKPNEGKRYQLRALVRKTIAYQRRQMCSNVCCIGLCPFAMVAMAALIAIIVTRLLTLSASNDYVIYCSNSTVFPTGQNISSQPDISGIKQVNYYVLPTQIGVAFTGPPARSYSSGGQSCSLVFDPDYPFSQPYEPDYTPLNPFLNLSLLPALTSQWTSRAADFRPSPIGGTLGQSASSVITTVLQRQTFPWSYVYVPESSASKWGGLPVQDPFCFVSNISELLESPKIVDGTGVLGKSPRYLYFYTPSNETGQNCSSPLFPSLPRIQKVPFYVPVNKSADAQTAMDDAIYTVINEVLVKLSKLDKSALNNQSLSNPVYVKYIQDINKAVVDMPFGGVIFEDFDDSGRIGVTIQYGSDRRISRASNYPFQGFRQLYQVNTLASSFLQSINSTYVGYKIVAALRAMPFNATTALNLPLASLSGQVLYPFGISFLLPVFVITLVKEKEDRILVMMRMNGLKTSSYYIAHYIHFYILHLITMFIFIIAGFIFRLDFFVKSAPGVYVILLLIWGHAQITMAIFWSTIFSKSRTSLMVVFLIVLAGVIINVAISDVFGTVAPVGYMIYPPFAFYRALGAINLASFITGSRGYTLGNLTGPWDDVNTSMIAMMIASVVFLLVALYLNEVAPSEYGVTRPWHFIFTEPYKYFKNQSKVQGAVQSETSKSADDVRSKFFLTTADAPEDAIEGEDSDVRAEKQRVNRGDFPDECPLVMQRLVKSYDNNYIAVKGMTLAVESDMVFGLLGPNGAGKTTTISILTGLYEATSGRATIAGFDVATQRDQVYLNMGICPQHDILWQDLNVEEHLYFYARLKGVSPKDEKEAVERALAAVDLTDHRNKLSQSLSGGQRRRLSIAIALTGNGKVVFLDEPTTGLDPDVRRLIWDIINRAKVGKTIILTTHSMEEAEVLCSRIGIMAKGVMRCLGTPLRLKNLYGSGFKITITCEEGRDEDVARYMEEVLPENWVRLDQFVGTVAYIFPGSGDHVVSTLFEKIEAKKVELGIKDWGLNQTSLEDVFLRIIGENDAQAD